MNDGTTGPSLVVASVGSVATPDYLDHCIRVAGHCGPVAVVSTPSINPEDPSSYDSYLETKYKSWARPTITAVETPAGGLFPYLTLVSDIAAAILSEPQYPKIKENTLVKMYGINRAGLYRGSLGNFEEAVRKDSWPEMVRWANAMAVDVVQRALDSTEGDIYPKFNLCPRGETFKFIDKVFYEPNTASLKRGLQAMKAGVINPAHWAISVMLGGQGKGTNFHLN